MNEVRRLLRLDAERWRAVDRDALWTAAAIVTVASFLLALTRFGGLVGTEPRSFVRLALVGIWGWIGLAALLWVAGNVAVRRPPSASIGPRDTSVRRIFAVAGLAHVPVLGFAGMLFVAAMLFRLLGPGTVAAVVVFAGWLPATLLVGVRAVFGLDPSAAVAVVGVSYAAWYLTVGRYLLEQVGHLL